SPSGKSPASWMETRFGSSAPETVSSTTRRATTSPRADEAAVQCQTEYEEHRRQDIAHAHTRQLPRPPSPPLADQAIPRPLERTLERRCLAVPKTNRRPRRRERLVPRLKRRLDSSDEGGVHLLESRARPEAITAQKFFIEGKIESLKHAAQNAAEPATSSIV